MYVCTLCVRILHSAEEDNLYPFDTKTACLCQSIEINNNKYVCMYACAHVCCIQSAGELVSQTSQLRILHSSDEDLSLFNSKIDCLYQSIEINNKHVCIHACMHVCMYACMHAWSMCVCVHGLMSYRNWPRYGLRWSGWYCHQAQHELCRPSRGRLWPRRPAQRVLCLMAVPPTTARTV